MTYGKLEISAPFGLCWLALWLVGAGLWPCRCQAAGSLRMVEARNVKMAVYSKGALEPAAKVEANRVFTDRHRMGFLKVRLLPVVVAEGVRIGITASRTNTSWPSSFRVKLAPFARAGSHVEWHDVEVRLLPESEPRLQVHRLIIPPTAEGGSCLLEGVSVRCGERVICQPRAKLLLEGQPGRVVWEEQGAAVQWDFFTTRLIHEQTNQTHQPGRL